MAGDRRSTAGNLIAQRDIEKVFAADDYSLIGIAGAAGLAIEIVRLFQVELEHYEKIEGTQLTLDGKANRLATMIRGNLGQALQGLAVVPLFAGFDVDAANNGRAPSVRADLQLRRGWRPISGAVLRVDRFGVTVRQGFPEEAVDAWAGPDGRRPGGRRGSLRRSRRRLGDGRS